MLGFQYLWLLEFINPMRKWIGYINPYLKKIYIIIYISPLTNLSLGGPTWYRWPIEIDDKNAHISREKIGEIEFPIGGWLKKWHFWRETMGKDGKMMIDSWT